MNKIDEHYLSYVRYCGKSVETGLLDIRKSAQALLGFDEAVRFFIGCQSSTLQKANIDLPVRIRQGSWEALIPDTIFWVKTFLGASATAYGIKAAQKMAENDFDNIGLKTVLLKSLEGIQWVIRIGKHVGTITKKKFDSVKFRNDNEEICIPNQNEEILWVPRYYLELYSKCPKSLLQKLADIVEEDRVLTVGLFKDQIEVKEIISPQHKNIFVATEEEDVLFPELEHCMDVILEGEVTRGNETTNSIGFRYNDHILTAYPKTGSVVRYKPTLFLKAKIIGTINRVDELGKIAAKRPKIIFDDIIAEVEAHSCPNLFK